MRRQGQYADTGVNAMMAAQMQHMSAQNLQHNSGMGHFPGAADSFQSGEEQYLSSKAEGQWQWNKDGSSGFDQLPSHVYKEGRGSDGSNSLFEGQKSDSKFNMQKHGNKDPRAQACQNDLELDYKDNTLPETFEALEQKFHHDIMNLTKEQQDAEDRENARHRERLSEINAQYQDKLLAIRAQQATHREEFLRKESQSLHQLYQQANMNSYQNSGGPSEAHSFNSSATAHNTFAEANRAYTARQYDSYERPDFAAGVRGRGHETRGPYPGGRAYNSGGRHF